MYRVLVYIPVPGVDVDVIKSFFDKNANTAFGYINMFNGSAISRLSIVSLGVMPYITSSIIMELMAVTFPALGAMKKDREGMLKYSQYIRYFALIIAAVQSIGVSMGIQSIGGAKSVLTIDPHLFLPISVVSMVSGTLILMWIGDQITKKGIGNGMSLIIFTSIVSRIPAGISSGLELINNGEINILVALLVVVLVLATILGIIYFELAERRVPITYSKRVLMQNRNSRVMNYIPIKLNISGVIPPIFASAVLMFPSTILKSSSNEIALAISDFISPGSWGYNALLFLLVVFFSFFYSSIAFNTKDITENLRKQGGFIPGIRPGAGTISYLNNVVTRLTFFGSFYLGVIATLPWLLMQSMGVPFYFGGTAVLIVVQVAIDTMRRIEAQIYMDKYKMLNVAGF